MDRTGLLHSSNHFYVSTKTHLLDRTREEMQICSRRPIIGLIISAFCIPLQPVVGGGGGWPCVSCLPTGMPTVISRYITLKSTKSNGNQPQMATIAVVGLPQPTLDRCGPQLVVGDVSGHVQGCAWFCKPQKNQ